MKVTSLFLPFAAAALLAAPAAAEPARDAVAEPALVKHDASIPFANHGGVWDWRAEGTRTIYFQDRSKHWYRAQLIGNAVDLPFVQFIGLDTKPGDRLDKFSGVYIRGQHYAFSSFDQVTGPPAKRSK